MVRSRVLALVCTALLLAACGGTSPTPADPRQTVIDGIQATLAAKAFHLSASVDGTLNVAETGGTMSLNGTTLEGDVDLDHGRTHLTIEVPALMGLSAELISIGSDDYLKSNLTGASWVHSTAGAGSPLSDATDPSAALTTVENLLDTTGVELDWIESTDCDAGPCAHVSMTIPADQLSGAAGLTGGIVPGDAFADGLVLDLYFTTSDGRLAEISTGIDSASVGTLTLRATLGKWDEPLSIEAPPASDVQEGGGVPVSP